MGHIFISAAHKSSGKTTLSIGLCAALRARDITVQPFKKGPDYIDPMWLSRAAGRLCYNLDYNTMTHEEILGMAAGHGVSADISLVEGNNGLFDGLDLEGSNSNAALAKLLETPVILVIDARGMTRGIAPLILGYQAFDPAVHIAGVILNQLGGHRHEAKLRAVIEHYTDVPVLGAVHHAACLGIDERHLGLIPSNETDNALSRINTLGEQIGKQVDIDALLTIAATASPWTQRHSATSHTSHDTAVPRLGLIRDAAFGFYYPDDLEALERAGAQLIMIDSLHDTRLPALDGIFIGGGFPETHMDRLSANVALREQLREVICNGMPAYAECGGLMYLARSLRWHDQCREMVGVIPGDAVMCERPQGRGYVCLQETADHPWPTAEQMKFSAHEFHYSRLENLTLPTRFAYRVLRGNGIDGEYDGIVVHNLVASYAHIRDTQSNHWARRFVQFVRQYSASAPHTQVSTALHQQPECTTTGKYS